MNLYTQDSNINKTKDTVITIGTFDGVHLGHQKILNHVLHLADEKKSRSFVITFEPHPRLVVSKNYDIKLLTTLDEKVKLFEKIGIDNLMVIKFTKEFSGLSSKEFVRNYICNKIGANHIVIGYDHKFGKNRDGDENKLRELGKQMDFDVTKVEPITAGDTIISSTKIRNLLSEGDIALANKFLGRAYTLSGKVVNGAGRGRSLGFPTANIKVENIHKLIPGNGVYAVSVWLNKEKFAGIMNIGLRPTFNQTPNVIIEVHILNFDKDIYNEDLQIEFLRRLRAEKKFSSKDELIWQINIDKKNALKIVNSYVETS